MAAPAAPAKAAALRERLETDTIFWARNCAKIITKRRQLEQLIANRVQRKFEDAAAMQKADGEPVRIIVLKARQLGFSTWSTAKIMQRVTLLPYRNATICAQDTDTAGKLWQAGKRIWDHLPPDAELGLKPRLTNKRTNRSLTFGTLESQLEIDTANEQESGRGDTISELLCTEVAFWPSTEKLTALLNAVPDEPDTMIVLESTANGSNHFKRRWEAAQQGAALQGESRYLPVFAAWWEDPGYQLPFRTPEDREEFVESIGTGTWGDDEHRLVSAFGCTPEQLKWRRWAIVDKTESKLEKFKQEYPASPEEAFMSAGKHVFSMTLISRVLDRAQKTDPLHPKEETPGPELGELKAERMVAHKARLGGVISVPTNPLWVPKKSTGWGAQHPYWRVWEQPDPGQQDGPEDARRQPGRYVVTWDPAEGEETDAGESAWSAIQVIDHRTRCQVAEFRSRQDPDVVGNQAYLAALYYNKAILGIEVTGGYGRHVARRVWREFRYPKIYRRKSLERAREKQEERLGWDTSPSTKPFLEELMTELLRTWYGDDAGARGELIKSRLLALEFTTYVKDERGRTGPEPDAHSDLLMAFLIAQAIAQEWVVPTERSRSSTATRGHARVRDPVTGY